MVDALQTVVSRWLAAGDAGDFDAFDALLHRDVVVHAPLGLSTATVDDEKTVWRDALAAMPDLRHDVQEVVDGEVEMARVVVTGTMAASFAGVEGSGSECCCGTVYALRKSSPQMLGGSPRLYLVNRNVSSPRLMSPTYT